MTTEVALQTSKRRKMGYDNVDDSGYPMDGIELDSSSSTATAANSSRAGNSSGITTHYSDTPPYYGPQPAQHMHNTIESTTSETMSIESNQIRNSDSRPTANSSIMTTQNKQQNQATQRQQERHTPANDLVNDYEEDDMSDPANDLTNNEAMTTEDDNDDKLEKARSRGVNIHGDSQSHHSDKWAATASGSSSSGAGAPRSFRVGGVPAPEPNYPSQNQARSNDQASACQPSVRNFGDLFDDDDLD